MRRPDASRPPTRRELREFGLTVGAAFLVLAAVLLWRGRVHAAYVVGAVGALLAAFGWLAPVRLTAARRGWMGLARALSRVTTPLFLGAVYFGLLTPLGVLMRLFGHRPLGRPRAAATFWADRDPAARRSDLRRQF